METKEDMISTPAINEAFCDAWTIAGKPDAAYSTYARCSMGYRTEPLQLFRDAFDAGKQEAKASAARSHEAGYNEGHDDGMDRGRRQGVLEVMAVVQGGDWPDLAVQVAQRWPELWRTATCQHSTKGGDFS